MNESRINRKPSQPAVGAVITALNHPLRRTVLRRLLEAPPISPVTLSRELERPLNLVSYHVRILEEQEVIRLVGTTPRRGALEHFFDANLGSHAEWVKHVLSLPEGD